MRDLSADHEDNADQKKGTHIISLKTTVPNIQVETEELINAAYNRFPDPTLVLSIVFSLLYDHCKKKGLDEEAREYQQAVKSIMAALDQVAELRAKKDGQ